MRSLRPVSMVAWVFACHLRPSLGQLYEKLYRIARDYNTQANFRRQYNLCQNCIINIAGLSGMWLNEFEDASAKFTATGMRHSFVRLKMYCTPDCPSLYECPPLLEISTSDKNWNRQEQNANKRASDQSNDHPLCLVHRPYAAQELCSTCLKETSDSDSIGEFLFVSGEVDYVVYVLHTSKTHGQVSKPCNNVGHCHPFEHPEYSEELCKEVHGSQTLRYFESTKSHDKPIASTKASNYGRIEENPNVSQLYRYLQCFKVRQQEDGYNSHSEMLVCMKCLGKNFDGLVHWIPAGSTPRPDTLFLIRSGHALSKKLLNPQICVTECPDLQHLETEKCYKDYYAGFDLSTSKNQISTNVPALSRENNYPLCALAYSMFDVKACHECLSVEFEKEKHKARKLNRRAALIRIAAREETRLVRCLSERSYICTRFLFLSTDVCNDEVFYPTISADSSGDTKVSGFPGESSSQSNRKGSRLQKKLLSSSELPDPGRVVTVVAVKYGGEDCLACLLVVHEVLLVSTENAYLWMVERTKHTTDCLCEWKTTGKKIEQFKMGPLRPLSVFEVNLGNYNKVDILNVHPDSMLKRTRRKRGKGIV